MKRKGFTLVELLSIIVILGVIVVVVLPNIGGSVTKKKQNEYDRLVSIIENAAKSYHSSNKSITRVDINTLVENNLLTTGLTDMEGEPVEGCVRIKRNLDGYNVYTYYKDCTTATVTLTVTTNGGNTGQEFEAAYQEGEKIELQDPTRSGYEFTGWQVVRGNSVISGKSLIFGNLDTEIYATWKSYPTLTVNLDGGTSSQTFSSSYPTGYPVNLGTVTKTGYTFKGWQVVSGNSILSGNTLTMGTTDTTVRTRWAAETYTITLSNTNATTNGSTSATATYNFGITSITAPQRKYTVTYSAGSSGATLSKTSDTATYTFDGWYTAESGGTKIINSDGTLVSGVSGYTDSSAHWIRTSGVTLYAHWTSASVTTATCTRKGHTCNYTNSTSCNVSYTPTSTITLTTQCTASTYTCSAKTYLKAGDITCSNCPAGYACAGGSLTYSDTEDKGIVKCSAGNYAAANSTSCTACPGSMTSAAGSDAKTDCKITCAAGKYLAASASACSDCPAGKYCAGGTYNYSDSAAQGITGNCNANTYSTGGASAATCTACGGDLTVAAGSGTSRAQCKVTCAAGKHLAASATACSNCPAGKYCAGGTYGFSTSAQGITGNCNANTYSTGGASAATCTACPGSMTSAAGSDAKTDCKITCAAGKHLAKSASACSNCPAGKYCSSQGTYNYSDSAAQGITGNCDANTYSTGGASAATCTACPGSMTSAAGSDAKSDCKITCAAGKHLAASASACSNCPGGKYCAGGTYGFSTSAQGITGNCNANTYSTGGASAATCTACPGSMTSAAGSDAKSDCKITCAAGKHLAASASTCSNCPAGKYCSSQGTYGFSTSAQGITGNCNANTYSTGGASAATCTACPGSMTSAAGSDAKSDCKITCAAGKHLAASASTCSNCPAGKYCSSQGTYGFSTSAQGITGNCNANTYSTGGASAATCTACPGSMTSAAGSDAKSDCKITCAAGKHLAASASACSNCPAGKYCSSQGTYGFSTSAQGITGTCSAGYYSLAGASSCTKCVAGTYSGSGSGTCTVCGKGKTSSAGATASSSCSTCSNSSNVSSWATPSWSANSVTNLCKIDACASGYKISGTACVKATYNCYKAALCSQSGDTCDFTVGGCWSGCSKPDSSYNYVYDYETNCFSNNTKCRQFYYKCQTGWTYANGRCEKYNQSSCPSGSTAF